MRKIIFTLALLFSGAAAFAQADCSKQTEACSAGSKARSPFVEASLRESVPPHMEAKAKKTAAEAAAVSTAAVPAGVPAETGGELSSPAWLLLVLAGFTALYFYLSGGAKRRKKK